MAVTIKLRQGTKTQAGNLTGLTVGEPLYATDTQELLIATAADAHAPAAIDVAAYGAIGGVATDDLIYMYDVSVAAGAVKARKITFADFKTALSIPEASSDEKVATKLGATAGYLGSDGTDGILRAGTGLSMTAGLSDAYVTMALSFEGEAQGDIIYHGATNWARLAAADTPGALLQSNGAGSNPSWQNTIDGGTFA